MTETPMNGPLRVGIGGPVGSGKITLTEGLARALAQRCSMVRGSRKSSASSRRPVAFG